jgi:hypothetical protein
MPSPKSLVLLFETRGHICRVPRSAMAFDHRSNAFELSIIANWTGSDYDAPNIRWALELWERTQNFVSAGVYVNHLTADETAERTQASYGAEKYGRLLNLKRRYDPENFFRRNSNIIAACSV